jgi:hypothetical protein
MINFFKEFCIFFYCFSFFFLEFLKLLQSGFLVFLFTLFSFSWYLLMNVFMCSLVFIGWLTRNWLIYADAMAYTWLVFIPFFYGIFYGIFRFVCFLMLWPLPDFSLYPFFAWFVVLFIACDLSVKPFLYICSIIFSLLYVALFVI